MKTLVLWAALAVCAGAYAQKINVGTAAPEGSPWHNILQRTREEWMKISGGKIELRIYAGGALGDEIEMTRKVRTGQLHAVGLSGVGLSHIERGVGCLAIPMLFDSYEEFDYVRDQLAPKLEALIEKRGFVVLQWSDVGWVHFFTKTPVRTPDEIRKLKLFTSAGDPEGEKLYKDFGLQVVPLPVTEMLTSLQTGMIQAFDVPPLFALLDQSFGVAKNMIDLKWVALSGATVMSRRAWENIPATLRPALLDAARKAAGRTRAEVRKMGNDAVVQMQQRGLKVVKLEPATLAAWRKEAESAYPKMRGAVVPEDLFDETVKLHKQFEAQHPQTGRR